MAKTLTGGSAAALLLSLLLIAGAPAQARGSGGESGTTEYDFTTLLDSRRDGVRPTRCAAINSLGTVAVTVRQDVSSVTAIVTRRGTNDAPVVVADTNAVPDFPTFCDNGIVNLPSDPSINDKGEVAFQGNLRRLTTRADCGTVEPRARRQGVFLGPGGPLTTIAHTIFSVNTSDGGPVATVAETRPGGYASFREPSLNALGEVVFTADVQPDPNVFITTQGVFTGPDPRADKVLQAGDRYEGERVTSVVTCREVLNNRGEIAMTVFISLFRTPAFARALRTCPAA